MTEFLKFVLTKCHSGIARKDDKGDRDVDRGRLLGLGPTLPYLVALSGASLFGYE